MSKKLSKQQSAIDRFRRKVVDTLTRPFNALSSSQKFWLGFTLLAIITTLFINNPFWRPVEANYEIGDIARQSIIAPADISAEDKDATQALIRDAQSTVKNIFVHDRSKPEDTVEQFKTAWSKLNQSQGNTEEPPKWTGAGEDELATVFTARRFGNNELEKIYEILRETADTNIYPDTDVNSLKGEEGVILINPNLPAPETTVSNPLNDWTSVSKARAKIKPRLEEIASLSKREVDAFNSALTPLIEANVRFDGAATSKAKEDLTKNIEPVRVSLKRGQIIVREGDTINEEIISKINTIKSYTSSTRQINRFLGLLLIVTALFWVAWKFIQHRGYVGRLDLSTEKTFALFGFIVVIQTFLMAISFRLAAFTAVQNVSAPMNDPTLWALACPFAFSSLLMTLLADRRTALFTGLFTSLLAGLLAPEQLEFALYAALSSAVAVYGIGRYRSRQSVTTAGSMVGIACVATSIALLAYTQQPFIIGTILLTIMCGLFSGLITAAVTAVFLPICENLFGILTDVKLLELSNADLPVLGQLALRAPGTNQHSHAVGQLAEEACRIVGGNGLLARIGALYHDIGKTAAPEHFVENQRGENPHDRLNPTQSAKIIISHVTYGTKLAKEMGLPERIVDFIPQHHGTRTLHYFLTKAKDMAGKGEEVHENEFRYPGPKPQFKESAIMMIADSCEAASRSLSEPTPENIRFIVTKIIDAILADDQLDECDLTLRELTQIRESMIKSLVSIYHSRVDYPGYTPPTKSMQNIVIPKDTDDRPKSSKYEDPAQIPISKGGEIEDEAFGPRSAREKVSTDSQE